ncbi:hypothetical protein IKG68_00080 [Candidatus Saccharibacteria bacterium]|nr:hypothetical protein [Candidatus Saccharibacteria bacterium]
MRSAKFAKHKILLIPLGLVAITLLSGYFLSHAPLGARAANNSSTTASVTVGVSCNMIGTETSAHTTEIINGQSQENIGTTKITTICNDTNGYAIYAVGFSGDTFGNTNMLPVDTSNNSPIATGTWRTSGDSVWNMKITKDTAEHGYGELSVANGFDANHAVPDTYTKVASYTAKTDNVIGSSIYTTYAAYVGQTQPAGTYIGKVKYLMVHPNNNEATTLPRMQDLTLDMCKKNVQQVTGDQGETAMIGDNILVVDERDNKTYTVRYINGFCWMTQNLRFTETTLDATTSNVASNYTKENPLTMTYYSLDSNDESYKNHCDSTNGYNYSCMKESPSTEYGAWYNFAAASAGTITGSSNSDYSPYDICPAGWHLPTGPFSTPGTDGYSMFQNTVSDVWLNGNISQLASGSTLGGHYGNGSIVALGYGYLWASTSSNETNRWRMDHSGIDQFLASSIGRTVGFYVRCVMNNEMQNITEADLALLTNNGANTTTLYDSRDNQRYTVAKLADGKYWMTKNLNLAGGTVLTSEDTDMAPGYTMPTTYVDPETSATLPTGFGEGNVLPASSKNGFDNDYKAFVYNTGNNTDTCTDPGCYSYYSYNAATLGSGMNITTDNTDAPYSVCPKGWKLPTSRSTLELAKTSSDFYQMAIHYGLNPADINETSDAAPTFCTSAGDCSGAPSIPHFLRAGHYYGSMFYNGSAYGFYWSSTASGSPSARSLDFYSGYVYSANSHYRRDGFAVRCLLRTE